MSIALNRPITNYYALTWLGRVRDLFALWLRHNRESATLAQFSARELSDIGLTHVDRIQPQEKPFWRT